MPDDRNAVSRYEFEAYREDSISMRSRLDDRVTALSGAIGDLKASVVSQADYNRRHESMEGRVQGIETKMQAIALDLVRNSTEVKTSIRVGIAIIALITGLLGPVASVVISHIWK